MAQLERITQTTEFLGLLSEFKPREKALGLEILESGGVMQLKREGEFEEYTSLVHDLSGDIYEVDVEWDPEEGCTGYCSCPFALNCSHLYAVLITLQSRNPVFRGEASAVFGGLHPASPPEGQDESDSHLAARVKAVHGAKLGRPIREYLILVQRLYSYVLHQRRSPTGYEFGMLDPQLGNLGWASIQLWPKFPINDFEFWLYCAWELRRRDARIPDFMLAVTDFSLIESRMKAWEREQETTRWRTILNSHSMVSEMGPSPAMDLRLVVGEKGAQVQWCSAPGEAFKDLKSTHVRRLNQGYYDGTVAWVPEAEVLWLSLHDRYDTKDWMKFNYTDVRYQRALSRWVRVPTLSSRVVTEAGHPLARPTEVLRYEMRAAQDEKSDYQLRLVRQDGSEIPRILTVLPGDPTLYLTADALFVGPPPHGFGNRADLVIPAPALESPGGVALVTKLGLELPERLAARTRRVKYDVNVFCDLKPTYPGSQKELVEIRVVAQEDGVPIEQFEPGGWIPNRKPPASKAAKSKDNLIPVVDRSTQRHFPQLLEDLSAKWEGAFFVWKVKLTKDFAETFVAWLKTIPPGIEVHLGGDLGSFRDDPLVGGVRLDVQEAGVDWFDLKVVLDVTETELTPDEIKLLLNARGGYVRLGKKGWRRLQFNLTDEDDGTLARLGLDARDFTSEPQRLHALQLADDKAARLLPPQQVEAIHRRASELKARVAPAIPKGIRAELRPYQVEGFHFLAYLTANHFGGVLADDMGLGKTLQTLTWLAWLRAEASDPVLASLVICPKSVMDNWCSEAEKFLPGLRVCRWKGEGAEALREVREQSDLIVMNYPQLRSLSPDINGVRWLAAILDEAQYIKNPDSQTAQIARSLQANHRLALTGTPIENRLLDLWSILAYAMPGVLGNRAQFTRKFNATDDPLARRRLAARVRPFLLRRTKGQVAKDLPDRIEEDLICELEGPQKTLYRAELKRAQQLLLKVQSKQELNDNRFNILTSLLRLRQICCHPALVDATQVNAESAKVNALLDLLEPLMEEGNKVLVFSQFVTMLDLIRRAIQERGWKDFFLAGDTENRGDLVKEFQTSEGAAVFLISLKAGGFGLNLTAASYVVLFDPWWNPAVESQAIDRTHRIGQVNKVIAYRLLIKGTIEEKIRQMQKGKAALADDVLGEETFAKSLTLDDLRFLLTDAS